MKSPPPIPAKILEDLKDYPDCIQEVQDALISYTSKKSYTPPFEKAIWALKDTLWDIYHKANKEAREAEARGDIPAMLAAKKKADAGAEAAIRMGDLTALFEYFGEGL